MLANKLTNADENITSLAEISRRVFNGAHIPPPGAKQPSNSDHVIRESVRIQDPHYELDHCQ